MVLQFQVRVLRMRRLGRPREPAGLVRQEQTAAQTEQHKGMVELTSAIAWENFRARFNRGFGIEAEGFTEGAACPVRVSARA